MFIVLICLFVSLFKQVGEKKGVVLQRAPAYKIIIFQLALVNDVLMCDAFCALILFYHLPC